MSRSLSSFLVALALAAAFAAAPAQAKDFRDKYEDITLPLLTDFLARSKLLPLNTREQLLDYLAVTECDIYKNVMGSQFKQQEIQNAVKQKIAMPVPGDGVLYIRVPTMFYVTEYNFDTQSMTLAPESTMRKVNTLDLISKPVPVCGGLTSAKLKVPGIYNIRLNIPISFYRVPLQKTIAESVYNKMDRLAYGKRFGILYGTMYMQVEPVTPTYDVLYSVTRTMVRGQLNVIDLYLDPDRKVLLRELDFDENY